MQLRHLKEAAAHIALGEQHIAEQEARIAEMACNGQDTATARQLLDIFRATHAQHVVRRDQLLKELGEA
jgi:hypothetical protein